MILNCAGLPGLRITKEEPERVRAGLVAPTGTLSVLAGPTGFGSKPVHDLQRALE